MADLYINRIKFLQKILFLVTYFMISESVDFTMFYILADSKMENSVATVPLGSNTACGVVCKDTSDCMSYSYTKSTRTCAINGKTPSSASSEMVASPGTYLYVKQKDCAEGWYEFWGSCYLFSTNYRSWESSKTYCESIDAHLAIVGVDEEHQFIRNTIYEIYDSILVTRRYFWIGARFNYTSNEYRWVDGSEVTVNGWRPGLPGVQKGCVDYLGIADWLWNAHSDCVSTNGPCICEKCT